jgi:hypothetical protein
MAKHRKEKGSSTALTPAKYAARRKAEREAEIIALALFLGSRAVGATRRALESILDMKSEIAAMELLLETRYPGHSALFKSCLAERPPQGDVIDLFEFLAPEKPDTTSPP